MDFARGVTSRGGGFMSDRLLGRSHWIWFSGILVAALVLRLFQIGTEPLWIDELRTWWFADKSWDTIWREYPTLEVHPPLYFALIKIWTDLFGDSEATMRLPAMFFDLGALFFVYLTAREVAGKENPWAALAAAALFAAATQQVAYSQEVRFYAAFTFAYSLVVFGTVWLLKRPQEIERPVWTSFAQRRAIGAYVSLAVGAALLMWFHNLGVLYNLALAVVLVLWWAVRLRFSTPALINLLIVGAVAILFYTPNLSNFITQMTNTNSGGYWIEAPSAERLLELFSFTYGFERPYSNKLDFGLTALMVSAGGLGLWFIWQSGNRWLAAAVAIFTAFPFLAATLITYSLQPVLLDRTLLPMFAPWSVLVGAVLLSRIRWRAGVVLFGVLLTASLLYTFDYYSRDTKEPWRQVVRYVEANAKPDEPVFLVNNIVQIAFDYYLRDGTNELDIRPLPEAFPANADAYEYPIGGRSEPMLTDTMALEAWKSATAAPSAWLVARGSFRFEETPDFVENWFATHSDCKMYAYPDHLNIAIYKYDEPSAETKHDVPQCGFDKDVKFLTR